MPHVEDATNADPDAAARNALRSAVMPVLRQINAGRSSYYPRGIYDSNADLRRAINTLVDGTVPTDDGLRNLFHSLLDWGENSDQYRLLLDYESYLDAKLRANRDYAAARPSSGCCAFWQCWWSALCFPSTCCSR